MIMVKKLFFPEDGEGGSEGGSETTVTNKWVPHNEREQQLYAYQKNVKTAEQEATAWANKTNKEFLEEHSNLLGSPMLDDNHKQFVPEGSGGGSGYEEKEMPLYWIPEQTIQVVLNEGHYEIAQGYTINSTLITEEYLNTEGVCVIDGTEYKAVVESEYTGTTEYILYVYNGDTRILRISGSYISIVNNFFSAEGTHSISAYFIGKDLEIDPLFKQAVTKFSNVLFLGIGRGFPSNVTNSIPANASDLITFTPSFSVPIGANYYRVTNVYPLPGKLLNNFTGFAQYIDGSSVVANTLTNVSGAEVTAEDINQNCFVELEFYKVSIGTDSSN